MVLATVGAVIGGVSGLVGGVSGIMSGLATVGAIGSGIGVAAKGIAQGVEGIKSIGSGSGDALKEAHQIAADYLFDPSKSVADLGAEASQTVQEFTGPGGTQQRHLDSKRTQNTGKGIEILNPERNSKVARIGKMNRKFANIGASFHNLELNEFTKDHMFRVPKGQSIGQRLKDGTRHLMSVGSEPYVAAIGSLGLSLNQAANASNPIGAATDVAKRAQGLLSV